jgi:hypothetical protein
LVLQNIHRYFMYVALVFLIILARDVWDAMWFADGFGIGLGTLILAANVVLLGCYALGCHSLRHLVGGRFDLLSPFRAKSYECVSCLNSRHPVWAWASLCSVMVSDVYIRLCATGIIRDWRII